MAINQAKNDKEIIQMFKPAIKVAVEYLLDKISEENQYAIMHEIYYGEVSAEEGWYDRTGQFAKAWETQVHTTGNLNKTVEGRFYYSPNLMKYNPAKGQHGSPMGQTEPGVPTVKKGYDVRQSLAEIIYQGLSGEVFGDGYWTKKRDAWAVLEKRIGQAKLKQWMKEGFAKAGINVKSHGTPWGVKKW